MKVILFAISLSLVLLVYPAYSISNNAADDTDATRILGGIIPDDATVGPVGNVDAIYKFDDGFYEKIQNLIPEEPQEGDYGVYDGVRYYDVLMVVSRDDGDGRDPDDTAKENKDALVKRLEILGARNIFAAESLSFVTASIPVAEIPGFSLHEEIYALGDGETQITSEVNTARHTIRATPDNLRSSVGSVPDGTGVLVGVVDTGINSIYLNDKVSERIYCEGSCFDDNGNFVGTNTLNVDHVNSVYATHGTQVAQVLAASGMPDPPNHNGIAPGVLLLDAMYGNAIKNDMHRGTHGTFTNGMDWSHSRGADIANLSLSTGGVCKSISTVSMVVNEAVDKGMIIVKSAGNEGSPRNDPVYSSITNPGCAHNAIVVGGINDRNDEITMFVNASRGPEVNHAASSGRSEENNSKPMLVPHIAAPAYHIETLNFTTNAITHPRSGTSYAAPQVSATAAMMLQIEPELTPAEVKTALLLGANWAGPVPCTSVQYEQDNPSDNCSFARQPTNHDKANNAASLGILNNVGFGILDAAESLRYVHSTTPYVISDHLDSSTESRKYRFTITDTSEPVKVILAWLAHPHGGIEEQLNRDNIVPVSNLDFMITAPDGRMIDAASNYQTTEFAVFNPTQTGAYTVKVSGSGLADINKPAQNFALGSTSPLTLVQSSANSKPAAQSNTLIVSPGMDKVVRISAADADGDAVSFHISRDPAKGTVTTDEFITKTTSRLTYTPNADFAGIDTFHVTPHDGTSSGTPAVMTLVAEYLPPGSTEVPPRLSDVQGDRDTLEVTSGFTHTAYSKTFQGRAYPVSAIHVDSVNMEGVDLTMTVSDGQTYTVAVPPSGARMIEFASPITIQSVTLSADGIDEEAAHSIGSPQSTPNIPSNSNDVSMSVGYVPSSCIVPSEGCPAQESYQITKSPNLAIPDRTYSQDTTSTVNIPINHVITSIYTSVDITHTYRGDLKVILTSPDGTQTVLHNRSGGGTNNILKTYSSASHAGLEALVGSQTAGGWTLSVGDYGRGDVGILNEWTIVITYDLSGPPVSPPPVSPPPPSPAPPTTALIFSDDFESGSLTAKWTESGEGDWRTATSQSQSVPTLPGHDASNLVLHSDNCDTSCTLTLKTPVDLTRYSAATLSFWRFIDSGLDRDEYLKVELYDGSRWRTIHHWSDNLGGDDHRWHQESYDLSSYLTSSNFKLRLVTQQSSTSEDVQLDDIMINAMTGSPTTQPPSPPTPPPTIPPAQSDYSVYVADTDDREVLAYSDDGDYLGALVTSRSGGLGKVWDVAFGPDSHLYASDNTNSKIRKYNGATGAVINADWASTSGYAYGLTWNGNTLYVATSKGIERFSSSGNSLGYFGDAHRSPSSSAVALLNAYDIVFCPDNRAYVADRSANKVLYYSSAGRYLGDISGTSSDPPNTRRAAGLACTGNLYQSGDDSGRVNVIRLPSGSLLSSITSSIDEPYGMDSDAAGKVYVANKDDDNIVRIASGTSSVFATGSLDDPRGVAVGPLFSGPSSEGAEDAAAQELQNDEPEFVLIHDGREVYGPVSVDAAAATASFAVQATDAEGDLITIRIIPDSMPEGSVSVTDHTNGTADILIDVAGVQPGSYVFWVDVSDEHGNYDREPYAVMVMAAVP